MFLSDRDKYKRNSPAYILMDTIADKLPKNQQVSADTMKEICERIDQRKYRENDRYSNTIKEIGKLVSIKKDRKTGNYNVGNWTFVDELDTKTVHDCTRVRIESSIDSEVRRSLKERRRWLELNEEFKEKRRKRMNNET